VLVGDDRGPSSRLHVGDEGAGVGDQSLADEDLVGAIAEFDGDLADGFRRRGLGFARMCNQVSKNLFDDDLVRSVVRVDGDVGERISGAALLEQSTHGRLGIGGLQQRPVGAFAHAPQQHLEIGFQPDRNPALADTRARKFVHEGAAAGRKHGRAFVQQARDDAPLAVAEIGLAEFLEDFRDGHPRASFNLRIGVDEGQAKARGKPFADGGLSRAHHADQHDRTAR